MHRVYFAFAATSNPNEQFQYFTHLVTHHSPRIPPTCSPLALTEPAPSQVAWLLGMCGRSFAAPAQYDDPNTVCTNILLELKELGYAQILNFPPAKLKLGHGDAVCAVLQALVDHALKATGFQFQKPVHSSEK